MLLGLVLVCVSCTNPLLTALRDDALTVQKSSNDNEIVDNDENDGTNDSADNPTPSILYVSAALGNDTTGSGSPATPYASIGKALSEADTSLVRAVYVTAGTYDVSGITLVEGISLHGGFSDDGNWQRDIELNTTRIRDTSNIVGDWHNPDYTIKAGSSITAGTVVKGFTIQGTDQGPLCACAVYCEGGSPTIVDNTIHGGTSASIYTYGVFNKNFASPRIVGNTIYGGDGRVYAIGVFNKDHSSGVLINNVINGGENAQDSRGITNDGLCNPHIVNNTIFGGNGSFRAVGILNDDTVAPEIINNIIFTAGSGTRIGIYEGQSDSEPQTVRHNTIFDCPDALYYDNDTAANWTDIAAMESGLSSEGVNASNNLSVDPVFADQGGGDWRLTASSSTSVKTGAQDQSGSSIFPEDDSGAKVDRDGRSRTAPWSIGAYECDD